MDTSPSATLDLPMCCPHIETSLTGFYMKATLTFNGLKGMHPILLQLTGGWGVGGGVKNFRKVLAGEGVSFILLGELYQILPNFAGSTDKQRQSSFIEILKLHICITSGEKLGRNLTENTSGSCFWQVAIISTDRVIHNKTMCFIVNEEITDVRILSLTNLKINHENDAGLQ